MYMAGTHIVSKYSGMRYTDFVAERIFKPLGMEDSTYYLTQAKGTGRLSQAWTNLGRRIPPFIDEQVADISAGAGGAISSAADLVRRPFYTLRERSLNAPQAHWVRLFVHEGVDPVTNATVLPKSVFDAVITPTSIVPALPGFMEVPVLNYGLGWIRNAYNGLDVRIQLENMMI
jgi:CubicO group peptidase (beta-lactamase class C family)